MGKITVLPETTKNPIKTALSEYSDEWKEVIRLTFMPKCEYLGYCPEKRRCERKK